MLNLLRRLFRRNKISNVRNTVVIDYDANIEYFDTYYKRG